MLFQSIKSMSDSIKVPQLGHFGRMREQVMQEEMVAFAIDESRKLLPRFLDHFPFWVDALIESRN